jgi:hypothetical protein
MLLWFLIPSLPFVLLRQKDGVFLIFRPGLYLLVCNWLHSVGQNHFHVIMLLNRGSILLESSYSKLYF